MDKVTDSGSVDTGSIPVRDAKRMRGYKTRIFVHIIIIYFF